MQKLIFIFILIFAFFFAKSQAPGIAWRTIDWEHKTPDFPAAVHIPGLNEYGPNEYQHQDDSGEDWWMDIVNVYDISNNHIGYMTTGFGRWIGYDFNTSILGGCDGDMDGIFTVGDHCNHRIVDNTMTPYAGTVGFYDLNGKQIWTKSYSLGGDGYLGIIQDEDGNYLMVGNTTEVLDPYGNLINHNPGTSNSPAGIDLRTFTNDCGTFAKRLLVTKIDPQGNVIWSYTYGFPSELAGDSPSSIYSAISSGYDIVEDGLITGGYLISAVSQIPGDIGLKNHLMPLHIGKNGQIIDIKIYGDTDKRYWPRKIIREGSDFYLTAIETEPGFTGMVYKIDVNCSLNGWDNTWNPGTQPVTFNNVPPYINNFPPYNGSTCHDLIYHDNKVIVSVGFVSNGSCTYAGPNKGDFYLYALDPSTGSLGNSSPYPQLVLSDAIAFDFKSGMTPTEDGGFAFVSSTRSQGVDEPNGTETDLNPILADFDLNIDCDYVSDTEDNDYGFFVWRTDAYVAKFNPSGFKIWETTFDSEDGGPQYYPGDFKEQECLYQITEADDGGLVICGNTSHNRDDYYLAKVFSDCQMNFTYSIEDPSDNIIEISTNTTWSSQLETIKGTILVKDGATITINNCFLRFADSRRVGVQTKIIVEKGGKLIIENNSVLTSLEAFCDKAFWDGIHVEGTVGTTQSNSNQGYVEMDLSTIKNARNAITTRAVNSIGETNNQKTGGGVIKVKNSIFLDCVVALEFMPYARQVGSTYASNVSFIRNCDFKTTDNFGDQSAITKPYAFVTNYGTYNVQIKGNRFVNERDELDPSLWGNGIISMDAGYSISNLCNSFPCSSVIKNEFINLQTGIEINQGAASNFNVSVDGASFDNNLTGIRVNGGQFGKLINNEFVIPMPNFGPAFVDASGIYLNGTWGFRVEANIFNNRGGFLSGRNNGIITVDSDNGGSGLTIYRNEFHDLMTGAETIGSNTQLQIDCNQFFKSATYGIADIFQADGTLEHQGANIVNDVTSPQSNQFFGTSCNNMDNFQIHRNTNTDPPILNYFDFNFASTFTNGSCVPSTGSVFLTNLVRLGSISNTCPTNLGIGYLLRKDLYLGDINDLISDIDSRINLIDGGNTSDVLSFLSNTTDNELIKNYLLALSPYLSDEVLIAAIDKNLSDGILKQILLANSSLSQKVTNRLSSYILPKGITKQIETAQDGTGPMIDLLSEITYLETEKLINVNDLVSTYLDSAEVDSAIFILQKYGNPQALCALVPIVAQKDTSGADTLITKIQQEAQNTLANDPDCKACQDNLSFCDFQKMMYVINNREGGYFSLSDTEKNLLQTIAESSAPISANAHAIINFINLNAQHLNGLDYLLPNGVIRSYQEKISEEASLNKLNIYPNPADVSFTIELNEFSENGLIELFDIYGKLILQVRIMHNNMIQLSSAELSNGLYLITYTNSFNEKINAKLVISK